MHPLIAEQIARTITEERLRTAVVARRVRAVHAVRRGARDRLGSALVRVGMRLHDTRARPATSLTRAGGPC